MLSTCHNSKMVDIGRKYGNDNNVFKPSMLRDYNLHMGGVDKVYQQLHGLRTLRKSYKWYKKLAFRLISQLALNAHKVYQIETGSTDTFLGFLKSVIASLVIIPTDSPVHGPIPDDLFARLTRRHFPSLKVPTEGAKDKRPTKKCRVCYTKGKRSEKGHVLKTVYVCRFCPSEPGLHPETCFEQYHTLVDYS